MADELSLLLERIRALLDSSADGVVLSRAQAETTLTEGYARALELDAECLRVEEQIDKLTRDVADGHDVPAGQLSGLLRRLHDSEERSIELRAVLTPLRRAVARAA